MKFEYNKYSHTSTILCGEVDYSILWPFLGSELSYLVWTKVGSQYELVRLDKQIVRGIK